MHKEELIQLHTLMTQMKKYFEENGSDNGFNIYDNLGISPVHVHRSKAEHKHAIFVLGGEIASVISDDEFSGTGRTSARMNQLAEKAENEINQ
ncbi:MAG: metal-binding protein [Methanosarcinales archaeon]|jgi:hypothetical protein|nr:MAG: hypothetical protein C5S44_09780 [ANME-2 cluster archaeon]MRG77841.1 metal-binding protein [ANME-2 cluster archaeon]NOR59614.1 metal-binding protein [Methanosarcinales archaeon]